MELKVGQYLQLRQAAENLTNCSSEMDKSLTNIKDQMMKIGNDGVWSSEAANQDRQKFNTLAEKFEDYKKALKACADYLTNYSNDLETLEKKAQGQN